MRQEVAAMRQSLVVEQTRRHLAEQQLRRQPNLGEQPRRQSHLEEQQRRQPHLGEQLRRESHFGEQLRRQPHLGEQMRREPHLGEQLRREPHLVEQLRREPNLGEQLRREPNLGEQLRPQPSSTRIPQLSSSPFPHITSTPKHATAQFRRQPIREQARIPDSPDPRTVFFTSPLRRCAQNTPSAPKKHDNTASEGFRLNFQQSSAPHAERKDELISIVKSQGATVKSQVVGVKSQSVGSSSLFPQCD